MAPTFLPPTFILPCLPPRPHRPPRSNPRRSPITPRAVAASPRHTHPLPDPVTRTKPSTYTSYILTLLSPDAPSLHIVSETVHDILDAENTTVKYRPLSQTALEAVVNLPAIDIDALRTKLYRAGRSVNVDVIIQEERVVRVRKKLAVFDLDSTLIAQETIDELAFELDVQKEVMAITERAMNGEIGFRDALSERVRLLKGLPVGALDGVKDRVEFTPGARELVRVLNAIGCETAVISGGFRFLADHVRDVLGLQHAFANSLEDEEGILTGRTVGEVVDAEFKQRTLEKLAEQRGLRVEEVLAVGDGSNDLLMMGSAGLGVAFNAKPVVQDKAKCRVNQVSLLAVLYLLGMSDEEIMPLLHA